MSIYVCHDLVLRFIRPEDLRLNDYRVVVEPQADRHVSAPKLERALGGERALE